MRNLMISLIATLILCSSCSMEWSEEANTQFVKVCEKIYAKQYKAADPNPFCHCLLGKVKEEALTVTAVAKIKKEKMDEMAAACMQ